LDAVYGGVNVSAWGTRIFDDDAAQDWAWELVTSDNPELVPLTLSIAVDPSKWHAGYLSGLDSLRALAAAEVVAAAGGSPGADIPDILHRWINGRQPVFDSGVRQMARQAIRQVATDSELKDLWEDEPDSLGRWIDSVQDLERRLG
jgi:hypothetical protein